MHLNRSERLRLASVVPEESKGLWGLGKFSDEADFVEAAHIEFLLY